MEDGSDSGVEDGSDSGVEDGSDSGGEDGSDSGWKDGSDSSGEDGLVGRMAQLFMPTGEVLYAYRRSSLCLQEKHSGIHSLERGGMPG